MESLTGENAESSTLSPFARGQVLNFLCQQEVGQIISNIRAGQLHTRQTPPRHCLQTAGERRRR